MEVGFQASCISYACATLLIYYVALNLPHDVQRLWGRRSIATLLSAINWLAITGYIIILLPLTSNTAQRCTSYDYASEVVILVNLSISPLVAGLRVHAVSGGNWRWVLPVWLLGMVPVGTNAWLIVEET